GRTLMEESDYRHPRLLRTRRERPGRRHTAEQRDEIAALHAISQRPRIADLSIAGHGRALQQKRPLMSALGPNRTKRPLGAMSALPPKADIRLSALCHKQTRASL